MYVLYIMERTSTIIVSKPTTRMGEFTLTFPNSITLKGTEQIGVQNLSLWYSWDNITQRFNNNIFQYIHAGTTYTITIPDGYYSYSDLNAYIALAMKTAGHYLLDDKGKEVYYITIQLNTTYYANTFTLTTVPATLPAGWSNPTGMTLTGTTMQIQVPEGMGKLLGLTQGLYPTSPQLATYQFNSNKTPEITPVSFVYVHCDWVSDIRFDAQNSDVISQIIVTDTKRGALYNLNPQTIVFYPVMGGTYRSLTIRMTDQNNLPLNIRDTSAVLISLLLKEFN